MVFANITSGNKQQNQAVVNSGAVLPFIRLIDSAHDDISEQVSPLRDDYFSTFASFSRLSFVLETSRARTHSLARCYMKTADCMPF